MDFKILHKWCHENHVVLHSGKCHILWSVMMNFHASSNEEKLLGILFGRQQIELWFSYHISLKKAGKNLMILQE